MRMIYTRENEKRKTVRERRLWSLASEDLPLCLSLSVNAERAASTSAPTTAPQTDDVLIKMQQSLWKFKKKKKKSPRAAYMASPLFLFFDSLT